MSTADTGAEQRRFVRVPIKLEALVGFGATAPVPCTVRDFCIAGVFVALERARLQSVAAQSTATLHFALVIDGVQQDYKLELLVARILGSGIGCSFVNPDPNTISLLQGLASVAEDDTPEALSATQGRFSPDFSTLREPLTEIANRYTAHMCVEFLRMANEALFLGARDAGNNVEETKYRDGQNELRRREAQINEEVPKIIARGVSILNNPLQHSASDDEGMALSDLSLVDKDDFEEFLTVSEVISELEPHFKEPLYELDRRLSVLANREIDEPSNPLGPSVICNAFAEVLKNLESDRIAINVIYRSLRGALEGQFERLLAEANQLLVDHGILPVVEREKPAFKKHPQPKTPPPSPENPLESTPGQFGTTGEYDEPPGGPVPPPGQSYAPGATPSPGYHPAAPAAGSVQPGYPPATVQPAGAAPPSPGVSGAVFPGAAGPAGAPAGQYPSGAMHPGVIQSGAIQPGVMQPGAVQPGAVQPGAVQPGAVQPGAVQPGAIQPGAVQPGAVQPGAVQPGAVQPGAIQPGHVTPGSVQPGQVAPGGLMFDATFGGFGGAPAVFAAPSMQQAYSTAQTQLALRRQVAPSLPAAADGSVPRMVYSPAQVLDGLTQLQNSMASDTGAPVADVDYIKSRITEAIEASGGEEGTLGETQSDAIEVIANLFESLIEDALVTDVAKQQLSRLQVPVHKAALIDENFFEASDHPVRRLLNRVAMMRNATGADGEARNARVAELVDHVNQNFQQDFGVFESVIGELEQLLRGQRDSYDTNVEQVVKSCIDQQKVLSERRDRNLEATDPFGKTDLPEEWNRWLDRCKALAVGDRMIMNANSRNPYPVTLVWIGEDFNPYVFVDEKGAKSSTLTMHQLAMYLRRGVLKPLVDKEDGAVDRALFGMVNRMHEKVEAHATHDELTGFMNRKSFMQAIERHLPEGGKKDRGAVLCQVALVNLESINDEHGVAAGDELLQTVAKFIKDRIGEKRASFGRLGAGELGVYWQKGGLQSAYKKLQQCIDALGDHGIERDEEKIIAEVRAGITGVQDGMTQPDQLMTIVAEACAVAMSGSDKPIYVAGAENRYHEQIEQMVSYIGRAIDRERLALLLLQVHALSNNDAQPAAHIAVTAEDRNGKLIPPAMFTQAMNNSERAFEVDEWVLKQTLAWMATLGDSLDDYAAVIIPLSQAAVRRDDLANVIVNELMQSTVPPGKICFEIADKNAVENVTETTELVRTLKEFGCKFILDEFGGGQTNYDYVKELAVDFVTIQSTYIAEAKANTKDFAMAKSINELAHFMGKLTIAKQDGTGDLGDILREIGVDFLYDLTKTSRIAA